MTTYAKLLLIVALICCPCIAQAVHDAPQPKRERLQFAAAAAFFAGTSYAQVYAQHYGAKECLAERNRDGITIPFGSSKLVGLYPRDSRVYAIGGSVLATATVLELTHHPTAAKRLLLFGGTAQLGVAGATAYAGCN